MLFSSLTFLTLFLPITLILYFLMPSRETKNSVLLSASLLFYGWGEPIYVLLMVFMVTLDYFSVILFSALKTKGKTGLARFVFIVTLLINFGSLIYFKYTNFIIENINQVLKTNLSFYKVIMPIGISFYTFQIVSYVIDAYWGHVKVQKKWYLLMTYLSLFPQLIAGPIVRYSTVENELENRHETWLKFNEGLQRFIIGLGKKVIIANNVAMVANYVYNTLPYDELTFTTAWIGTLAFTLQIYFDFSAYSDMAIGMGKMFAFDFLENFNYPYIAESITDFWRRWHISLSTWFKDYIYIPLGGNRVFIPRWILNISIVWLLTGIWHGANWNFVLWGLYFGLILILEKLFLLKVLKYLPIIRNIYTLILVIFSWVLFNAHDLTHVQILVRNMFDYSQGFDFLALKYSLYLYTWPYFVIGIIGSTPILKITITNLNKLKLGRMMVLMFLSMLLFLSLMYLVNDSYNPFIYFRF